MSLPESLELAASALPDDADAIRPANGDPVALLEQLDVEAAGRVLGWLLANEPDAGEELALSWAEESRGLTPLAQISDDALPKQGRKALRRVRHRMRSRGIEAGASPPPTPVVARLPDIEDTLEAGFVSALDPGGARIAFLVEPNPSGGARLFEAQLDEGRGILEFDVFTAGRSRVRRFLRDVSRREGIVPVETPALRALILRAAEAQPENRPLPQGFAEWRPRLAAASGDATPGELARDALGAEDAPRELRRAAELVTKGELGPWPAASERLTVLAERIRESAKGRIIVSGEQRKGQIQQALADATGELFADQKFAAQTAARFEESAYVLWKSEREEDARACLAAGRAFRTTPGSENQVGLAMLEVILAPLLESLASEEEKKGDDRDSGLLVVPK